MRSSQTPLQIDVVLPHICGANYVNLGSGHSNRRSGLPCRSARVARENAYMTGGLRLHKLHGLGNDFLVALVDAPPTDADDGARTAAALCHRRVGIGADGLIYAASTRPNAGTGTRSATHADCGTPTGQRRRCPATACRCLSHTIAFSLGTVELDIVVRHRSWPVPTGALSDRPRRPEPLLGTTEMGLAPDSGPQPDRLEPQPGRRSSRRHSRSRRH